MAEVGDWSGDAEGGVCVGVVFLSCLFNDNRCLVGTEDGGGLTPADCLSPVVFKKKNHD